jgi:threonine synthase
MKISYECVTCHHPLESEEVVYECPRCLAAGDGKPHQPGFPRGHLSVVFTPPAGMSRGNAVDPAVFLPLSTGEQAAWPVGNTPLIGPARLREKTGFPGLFLKNDTLNPSGSLKDRASLLVAAQARARGETRVALASTGNAGASMACAGAAYSLEIILFVPAAAPRAKLLQSLLYGARVVPVKGTYDDAFSLSLSSTKRFGGINRNTGYNPLTVEGKKTVSIELYNQLGCRVPDVVYVPTGDGVIYSGACKGFADLVKAGCAERMPVMVSVQAQGSNAIARSWREGREVTLERADTVADSLSVARPASGQMALGFLRQTGGRVVEVSDQEIGAAQRELAAQAGIFVEPSSAAAWAGFIKDRMNVDPASQVVVLLTGTGFKDTGAAEKLVSMPAPCAADLESAAGFLADVYGLRA